MGAPLAGISSGPPGDLGVQSHMTNEHRAGGLLPGPILRGSQLTQHPCPFLPQQCPSCKDVVQKEGAGTAVLSFLVLNEIKTAKDQENCHFQAFFQDGLTRQLPGACQLFILEGLKVEADNIFLSSLI